VLLLNKTLCCALLPPLAHPSHRSQRARTRCSAVPLPRPVPASASPQRNSLSESSSELSTKRFCFLVLQLPSAWTRSGDALVRTGTRSGEAS
jgi:hypothetical protein